MKKFDFIFRSATVVDGTGNPRFNGDVGVTDGFISAMGDLRHHHASTSIECQGKILSPGFIDTHTHDDALLLDQGSASQPKIVQGVTTVIAGNCGVSLAPFLLPEGAVAPPPLNALGRHGFRFNDFRSYLSCVEELSPATNAAFLVGHTTLRIRHVADLGRPASATEIAAMSNDVADSLDAGAIGMSTGVYYPPARAATAQEMIDVGLPLKDGGGLIAMHIRDESTEIDAALKEAFSVGHALQVPLVISHHKLLGRPNHGRSAQTLKLLAEAGKRQDVCMDCYPYAASSSMLLPERIGLSSRVVITWSKPFPEYAGRDLSEIARELGLSQHAAMERLKPGGAVYFAMDEQDVQNILAEQNTMIGSDGVPHDEAPHPRLWGTFPRVLGHYVRDVGLFSLEVAVHKMTGLPARKFGLTQRGRISPGFAADLVLFDEQNIADTATYERPISVPRGIDLVMINGCIAAQEGHVTAWHAGKVLRRTSSTIRIPA